MTITADQLFDYLHRQIADWKRKAISALARVEILEDRLRRSDECYKQTVEKLENCLAEEAGPLDTTKISVFSRVCIRIRAQRSILNRNRETIERQRETIERQSKRLAQRDVPVQNAWRWTLRRDAEAAEEVKALLADMPEKRFFGQETLLQIAVRALKRLKTTIDLAKPFLEEDRGQLKILRNLRQDMIEVLHDALVGLPEFNDLNGDGVVWRRAADAINRLRQENASMSAKLADNNIDSLSDGLRVTSTGRFSSSQPNLHEIPRRRTEPNHRHHVDCVCWRTGTFNRVDGCAFHPHDL